LARVHRELHIVMPTTSARAHGLGPDADLPALARETVLAINPFAAFTVSDASPAPSDSGFVTAGIGLDVPDGLDLYAGWGGGCGQISDRPTIATQADDGLIGAATASCMLAACMFRASHGSAVNTGRINLVERTGGCIAATTTVVGPIDTGDTLVVGAGAVGQ